jgi:peptidoglycan-N-acetylglucosamine deacetylase
MSATKRIASLSVDLDNQWSYMRIHGDPGWERFPSFLDLAVPRILELLRQLNLTVTFFVVGQDAALEQNYAPIRSIGLAGHEVSNHSFHHEPWLHLLKDTEIEEELRRAEQHIERVTGQRPVGFRGPGYSLSPSVLRVLARRGYLYDASTLPTFLGPLARLYYFATSRLTAEQRQQRKLLFGTLRDGLRPIHPYRWRVIGQEDTTGLVEIPVTTMPLFRVPIHVSYIMYLATFSAAVALSYFKFALTLLQASRAQPSLLLHPLDFLDSTDVKALSFFPAMRLPGEQKMALVSEILRLFSERFEVVTVREHALAVAQTVDCPVVEQRFSAT